MSTLTDAWADPETRGSATDRDLDDVLADIAEVARPRAREGEVASYIPQLAEADADAFGIAVVELDGTEHVAGDADEPFPIQSISKVFSLVLAMQRIDREGSVADELWKRCGREPSGDPFNSLIQLERERGIPRNPMINAGALVVDDVLLDHCRDSKADIIELLSTLTGEEIGVDDAVLTSESETSGRNHAIAYLMRSFGNLRHDVDEVIEHYTYACAVSMTTRQLARAVRFLANDGVDPASGARILSPALARRVNAVMLTCGTYDAAGEFAFSIGLPCKSGVAGGIISVVPQRYGACVWSPPLDEAGNSVAGAVGLHELAERMDLSIF